MSQLSWSADWATGFQDIDEQHQHLIEQINHLAQAREQNDPMQAMQALFDFVAGAMNHFAYEEEMLKEANYKLISARHTTHQNFTDRLISYQERIFEDLSVLDELLPQIEVWMQRHIDLNDKAYIETVMMSGIYQINKKGNLERPIMMQKPEGAFQEDLDAAEAARKEAEKAQQAVAETSTKLQEKEDDAPRSWATGAY
ncbi:hemerythrin domain-containing protein [Neisseriaceae bacterium B1]